MNYMFYIAFATIFATSVLIIAKGFKTAESHRKTFRNTFEKADGIIDKAFDVVEKKLDQQLNEQNSNTGTWVCESCNATNKGDEKFCPYCGTARK